MPLLVYVPGQGPAVISERVGLNKPEVGGMHRATAAGTGLQPAAGTPHTPAWSAAEQAYCSEQCRLMLKSTLQPQGGPSELKLMVNTTPQPV